MPDTGSGYGGKHTGEAAIEAARLARGARRPVTLVWTRNEEFTWAYFRPAGVIDVRAAVDADGTITAWEFHNYNSGSSGIRSPYEVANQRIEFHGAKSPLRQGSYRGLAATANHFARESAHGRAGGGARRRSAGLPAKTPERRADRRRSSTRRPTTFGWSARKRATWQGLRPRVRDGEGRLRGHLRGGR